MKCGAEMNTYFSGLQNSKTELGLVVKGEKPLGKGEAWLGSKALFKLFANVFLCLYTSSFDTVLQ